MTTRPPKDEKTFTLTPEAIAMLRRHEGMNQPGKWPGGYSGITLGWGYDLAHCTREEFLQTWRGHLSLRSLQRLTEAIGVRGLEAKAMAPQFRDITITAVAARAVFVQSSLPRYWELTCQAFPGVESLPSNVQGALFSLVYNRGAAMTGERRREMRAIQEAVVCGDLPEIAVQLRSMKRIWKGQGLAGLLRRREDEACLVDQCILREENIDV